MICGIILFVVGCWIATQNTSSKLSPILIAAGLVLIILPAKSEEQPGHTHEGAVGKFYQSWMMPDNRSISCCHEQDCAPAQSRMVDGHWQARNSDDEEWADIPDRKIERDRDSPDGQSHLCKRATQWGAFIYCFLPGSGG